MKTPVLLAVAIFLTIAAKAQIPQQMNYQGIARNAGGAPIAYQNIAVRISVIDSAAGGLLSYRETRKVMTNAAGLFNIVIGSTGANSVSGSMQDINWPTGKKYIRLEIDPNGSNNFSLAGTTQLQSVPYALSAATSGSAGGDLTGTYPSPLIANNAITNAKIADGSVTVSKLDASLSTSLVNKVNVSDTATMLLPYATKAYVDAIPAVADATSNATGKIQLSGDLAGTSSAATNPVISNNAITTNKILDANVTDAKIAGVSGAKVNGDIAGKAANVTGIVAIANGGTGSATKPFVDLTSNQTIAGSKTFSSAVAAPSFVRSGGTSSQFLMADGSVSTATGFSGSGTANYLPKFNTASSFGNSSIYDGGTKVGIFTAAPSSQFQIGGETNTDLNLKYDFQTNTSAALKLGYRAYQWRMKTNTNSGILDALVFSYFNGSTDVDRLSITPGSGVNVTDNLTVTGNIFGQHATLSSVDVNNGQFAVDKTNNRIGFFNSNPSSMFQVGGESNTDLPLRYDVDPNNGSALKIGYRGYLWKMKTSTESGVLRSMVFSYDDGVLDVNVLELKSDGSGVIAPAFSTVGGTSSQFLKADGSLDNNTYLTSSSVSSSYLPVSGGTLTGALTGTDATFSNDINVHDITVGTGAGGSNTNVAVGSSALQANTSGQYNVAIGSNAMTNNQTGVSNTVVGSDALPFNTTGKNITALGWRALYSEQGSGNTAIGFRSGSRGPSTSASLTNSTFLGGDASAASITIDNATAIGFGAYVTSSNSVQIGNTNVTSVSTSGKLTTGAITYPNSAGNDGQALITNGSGTAAWKDISIREVADEFAASASQLVFTLTQTPSPNSKVKMYINGRRISNTAFSISENILTYNPVNNYSTPLYFGDLIQMDYFY